MTLALLIVDIQNDFTEGGALAVQGGDAVARNVTSFLTARRDDYDLIVGSRDWHDADGDNGGHFAHGEPDYVDTWPVHCVAGTRGADYDPLLDIGPMEVHVRKGQGRPAYSAFEGTAEDGRELAEVLVERGVTEVHLVGIATDHCVLESALDAIREGFAVTVFSDLVAGVGKESSEAALVTLAEAGAVVTTSA